MEKVREKYGCEIAVLMQQYEYALLKKAQLETALTQQRALVRKFEDKILSVDKLLTKVTNAEIRKNRNPLPPLPKVNEQFVFKRKREFKPLLIEKDSQPWISKCKKRRRESSEEEEIESFSDGEVILLDDKDSKKEEEVEEIQATCPSIEF